VVEVHKDKDRGVRYSAFDTGNAAGSRDYTGSVEDHPYLKVVIESDKQEITAAA
jgi:hypothetical protein